MASLRYRRIVVKVGTNVLTTAKGLLDDAILESLTRQLVELRKGGTDVILVSSGAMAAGRATVKPGKKLSNVAARQVLAAVGQVELMHRYSRLFRKEGCICAQVLATKEDFRDRQHYLNMRDCFASLLQEHIIPVVNENDVVSVSELMFTDNDELAGLIAAMVGAEALFLLTSVDGVLDDTGAVIPRVHGDADWKKYLKPEKSSFGRGGMHTKCANAQKLTMLGITTHIVRGTEKNLLPRLLSGEALGTVFPAKKAASSVKRWVAESEGREKGIVTINAGAASVITSGTKAASLLPVGIITIDGDFSKGDLLRIRTADGVDIGLGLAQYASGPAREAMGKKGQRPLVHYDYLSLF